MSTQSVLNSTNPYLARGQVATAYREALRKYKRRRNDDEEQSVADRVRRLARLSLGGYRK